MIIIYELYGNHSDGVGECSFFTPDSIGESLVLLFPLTQKKKNQRFRQPVAVVPCTP